MKNLIFLLSLLLPITANAVLISPNIPTKEDRNLIYQEVIVEPGEATYATGYAIGVGFTLTKCGKVDGGTGLIVGACLVDTNAGVKGDLDIVFYTSTPTATVDNTEYDPPDSELVASLLTYMKFNVYAEFKENTVARLDPSYCAAFVCHPNNTALYGHVISRANNDWTAGDKLRFRIAISQD